MAVPDHVSTFVKAGMNEVWKSCYNTRRIEYKSFKYDIFSRNGIHVIFKFVMSLIVTITFASITATILYVFDADSVFTIQGPAVPGMVDWIKSTVKSTSLNLHWKASEGMVDAYIVEIADGSSFQAEYPTDGPSVLIENLEINTLYKVDIYAVSGNMMSERRTEEMKTKDIQVYWGCMTKAILTGGIAVAGVASFAPFLGVFGFGAAGVGKGTLAASWMSSYGGTVASGGVFSTLQSLGVVGLGATAKAAIIASGMALGCITEVA